MRETHTHTVRISINVLAHVHTDQRYRKGGGMVVMARERTGGRTGLWLMSNARVWIFLRSRG